MGGVNGFKPLLRLLSAGAGLALTIICCIGFKTVNSSASAAASFGGSTNFGCLCFLGVCFGALLTLAETQWEWFFFLFGFLRYRVGRALVFMVTGIMTALIGRKLDQQCKCETYLALIIIGAGCILAGSLHVLVIPLFGNTAVPAKKGNQAPSSSSSARAAMFTSAPPPAEPAAAKSGIIRGPKVVEEASSVFQPIVLAPAPAALPNNKDADGGPDLPSWMTNA